MQNLNRCGEGMAEKVRVIAVHPSGEKSIIWTLKGSTLHEVLEVHGYIHGICGGRGTCGKCAIQVQGAVNPAQKEEFNHLMPDEIRNGIRLACFCKVLGDCQISMPDVQEVDKKSARSSLSRVNADQESVTYKQFFIPGLDAQDPVPLYNRIAASLDGYKLDLQPGNLNELVKLDRPGRPSMELYALLVNKQRVVQVRRHRPSLLGLAVDLGSTSLFTALYDLESGQELAIATHTNMQRVYGEDVLSRISYALEHPDGLQLLQQILVNNLNNMIADMLDQCRQFQDSIAKVTVVGNPVMLHLLWGLDVSGLGLAPYTGIFTLPMQCQARDLGLDINPVAAVFTLAQLGGFVGADTTACLLTLADVREETFLLIDVGTNGEIVLNHGGEFWTASAAAGPAFEGGGLSCGIRASEGAIYRVGELQEGSLSFDVLGDGPVKGLCGSGVVDLIAMLLKHEYLDGSGQFTAKAHQDLSIEKGPRGNSWNIPVGEAGDITLDQEDIRQVQLAKSAIRTAIDLLLTKANLTADDLDAVYLAGVFGSFLRAENLIRIGMLPSIPDEKVKNIGNAAARGAVLALLSDKKWDEATHICEQVHYLSLAEEKDFQDLFLTNINFPL